MLRMIVLVALLCLPAARAADPPRPNPDNPVDYVKWTNDQFGKDLTTNAADGYLRAVAAFEDDDELLDYAGKTDAKKWTSLHRSRLAKLIETNAKCLDQFAAAARTSQCYFKLKSASGSMIEIMLPELSDIRGVGKLTATRAKLRLMAGDVDGAVEDVITLLRPARHLQEQPFLIQYLVGLAVGAYGYNVLLDFPRLAPQSTDYEKVLASLKKADRAPRRPFRQLEFEKLSAWDFAQRYLRDTDGDGRLDTLDAALDPSLGMPAGPLDKPRQFDAIVNEINDHYVLMRELFVPSYAESRDRAAALDKRLASRSGTTLRVFAPSLTGVARVQRKFIASRNAYRIIFHLHIYHAKHNKWPRALADALPKRAARKLMDPFSNKPFGYRLTNGDPLLYTAGENGTDDGGEAYREEGRASWGKTGDYIYWPSGWD